MQLHIITSNDQGTISVESVWEDANIAKVEFKKLMDCVSTDKSLFNVEYKLEPVEVN